MGMRGSQWIIGAIGSLDREERANLREHAACRLAGFVGEEGTEMKRSG